MIPKIIHYCWFGGKPLPKLAVKCKKSWKNFFPDYEIKEWNEKNYDVNALPYTKYCYDHQLWAYLSDYVRLDVVEREGGLYFDTDVEVIRYPDELLANYNAWFGWETSNFINTGLGFAAEAHHSAVLAMMKMYEEKTIPELEERFSQEHNLTGCPRMNTWALIPAGLTQDGTMQVVNNAIVLPVDYLCPLDDITGEKNVTDRTISVHWFSKSPQGKWAWIRNRVTRPIHRIIQNLNLK